MSPFEPTNVNNTKKIIHKDYSISCNVNNCAMKEEGKQESNTCRGRWARRRKDLQSNYLYEVQAKEMHGSCRIGHFVHEKCHEPHKKSFAQKDRH